VRRTVAGQEERSIRVDDGAGGLAAIASRLVHKDDLGFLILKVGDLGSETTLLDPLAKSVLQFLRLLLPEDRVRQLSLRTLVELEKDWGTQGAAISHVVIIGHGTSSGLLFVGEGEVPGGILAERLLHLVEDGRPRTFVSLACLTGRAAFARPFSASPICRELLAPFDSVHGAEASQYCQLLLTRHLLKGKELGYAHRDAVRAIGGTGFRWWRNGSMR
jgi:hypothetical protein